MRGENGTMNENNETERNEIDGTIGTDDIDGTETRNENNETRGGTAVMRMTVEVDGETCLRMERPLKAMGGMQERVPILELAMTFTGTRAVSEPEKGVMKTVRRSGSSLACNLTRELRELGLDHGDMVEIVLRKVRE